MSNQVTVGICAYNEAGNIANLLNNILFEQALPPKSEVIVVCSGCTDSTKEIVQKYAAKDSRLKLHIEEKRSGKATAINYILNNATGDAVLFISADTLPKKGSFSRLIQKIRTPNVGIACGNPVPVNPPTNLVGKLVQLLWGFHGHVFGELNDKGLARHATELFCIRRGIVDSIPSQTINDDAYIAVTAKKKGWLIKYDPEALVSICGPVSFQEYFQQRRRIIFGHYQIRKLTSESPQYLVHLMPTHPLQTLKLIPWLFTKYNPLTIATFLFAEIWVNLFAIFDVIAGKNYIKWPALPSTKKMIYPTESKSTLKIKPEP